MQLLVDMFIGLFCVAIANLYMACAMAIWKLFEYIFVI